MHFGDRVVNIFASDNNPHKRGLFVRQGYRQGKLNPGKFYEITDGNGHFWTSDPAAIKKEENNQ